MYVCPFFAPKSTVLPVSLSLQFSHVITVLSIIFKSPVQVFIHINISFPILFPNVFIARFSLTMLISAQVLLCLIFLTWCALYTHYPHFICIFLTCLFTNISGCSMLISHSSYNMYYILVLYLSLRVFIYPILFCVCLFLTHLICITSWCCISHLGCSYNPRLFCVC